MSHSDLLCKNLLPVASKINSVLRGLAPGDCKPQNLPLEIFGGRLIVEVYLALRGDVTRC